MTRYQWIIYISEARLRFSGGRQGLVADLDLALLFRSPAPPSEYNIEVGEYGLEPGEARLYVYLECQDLLVAGRVAKSVVKILNRIVENGDKKFYFEDAQISVIKDGEE